MASHRQLDTSRVTKSRPVIRRRAWIFWALLAPLLFPAAELAQTRSSSHQKIAQLFQQELWQAVVDLDPKCDVAESCFYYGSALAHLGRWAEAKSAFETGRRSFRHDARFPVELAGVAFKEKKYAEAQSWLQEALRLSADDTYANDFL